MLGSILLIGILVFWNQRVLPPARVPAWATQGLSRRLPASPFAPNGLLSQVSNSWDPTDSTLHNFFSGTSPSLFTVQWGHATLSRACPD